MLPTEIQDLVRTSGEADPRDARRQTELLERLAALREVMRQGGQEDLAAYLEAACLLTECLASPTGQTPERIAQCVAKLMRRVETTFRSPRALAEKVVESGGLELSKTDLRMVHDQPLGEILMQHGRVSRDQIEDALRAQRATGMRLGETLVMLGAATWDDIHHAVRLQQKMRTAVKSRA